MEHLLKKYILWLIKYSVDQIIWFSTEYQIMIFGYKPNINYLQILFG